MLRIEIFAVAFDSCDKVLLRRRSGRAELPMDVKLPCPAGASGELEMRMVTGRGNGQNLDWMMPDVVAVVENLWCSEGTNGGE